MVEKVAPTDATTLILGASGTGKELFLGFLIVFFLVLLPLYMAFQALPLVMTYLLQKTGSPLIAFSAFGILYVVLILIAFVLGGIAIYRARRYRLSRTRWRGIRGSMAGSPMRFGWTFFWTMLLVPLTLGWIVPWRNVRLQKQLTDETRLGETPLFFDGSAKPLYRPFAIFWFGALLLIVLSLGAPYMAGGHDLAAMMKKGAQATGVKSRVSGMAMLSMMLGYLGLFCPHVASLLC